MPAYRGEVAAFHPKFPAGSPAACKETDVPVPIDAPDVVYSDADNEAIVKFHRDAGELPFLRPPLSTHLLTTMGIAISTLHPVSSLSVATFECQ